MQVLSIIRKYYPRESRAYALLVEHSRMVAQKALAIARRLQHLHPDLKFIEEAAMLHDIGIFMVNEPEIYCFGEYPYVCHGYLGRALLEKEGLTKHARVCETHVGVGISKEEIEANNLPLPPRDMLPETLEEELICYADKFYSKNPDRLYQEIPIPAIRQSLAKYGRDKVEKFDRWVLRFEG